MELIKVEWGENNIQKTWEESYELAKKYFIQYNNLDIKTDFKTSDGVTYDENGYSLGSWISIMRKKHDKSELDLENVTKLNEIGMIWNINENYKKIKECLIEYEINPRKYGRFVKHLSYLELRAKMMYLTLNRIPIIVNGELNEIFNMADLNMQIKYGISKSEIILNYADFEKRI